MIRSALKRGIKKVLGMEERVSPAPPPPAWKAESAAAPVSAAPVTAPVEAPAVKTSEAAPVQESPAPAPVEPVAVKTEAEEKPAQLQWTPDERERPGTPLVAEHAQVPVAPPKKELPPSPSVQPVGADDVVGKALSMEAVQEIMDEMVRPALQGDGGDITLIKVENNDIFVKLVGACSTCPSSIMTMKMGVEALLKEEFPEMGSLIQVDG
ncbi:MAG TPA: NifU family protein [Myxococcota bacterium]|nr:NifU family protein [Myxococcota bacterium]HNH45653.1 NifU family protein [Myxococcota bacterium]